MQYKRRILECPLCQTQNLFNVDEDLVCRDCGWHYQKEDLTELYELITCECCESDSFTQRKKDGKVGLYCNNCLSQYHIDPKLKPLERLFGTLIKPVSSEIGQDIQQAMQQDSTSFINQLMNEPDQPVAQVIGLTSKQPTPATNITKNRPYIFISYAHKDSNVVLPLIQALQQNGFCVWYDQGIEAGTEWPEYIAERIAECSVFLTCISPSAVQSHNCRNEINFALSLKKECLSVYLEDTNMTLGMQLQLGSLQALFKYRHANDSSFYQALINAPILQKIK